MLHSCHSCQAVTTVMIEDRYPASRGAAFMDGRGSSHTTGSSSLWRSLLGTRLVTADKAILKAFPELAMTEKAFVDGRTLEFCSPPLLCGCYLGNRFDIRSRK